MRKDQGRWVMEFIELLVFIEFIELIELIELKGSMAQRA